MPLSTVCRCSGCGVLDFYIYGDDKLDEEKHICEDCWGFETMRCSIVSTMMTARLCREVVHLILTFNRPNDVRRQFKQEVLRDILMGEPYTWCVFYNLFSYGANGEYGRVSKSLDIVDYIIRFVY